MFKRIVLVFNFLAFITELREKADKKLKLQSDLGQGIVAPQDFVNKASAEKLNGSVSNGEGIFVLSQSEFESKNFLVKEKGIIKPYYTTDQLQKYYGSSDTVEDRREYGY